MAVGGSHACNFKQSGTELKAKIPVLKGGFLYVLYSTLFHLPPLRFHCVGGRWDRTQDNCNYGYDSRTYFSTKYYIAQHGKLYEYSLSSLNF
jgi:hypothetical protein